MSVVSAYSPEAAALLNDAFAGQDAIALDVEGVGLSRDGAISLVQLATPTNCFLIDVLDKHSDDALVVWLRELLERRDVTKIIHDCRMDADALYHILRIELANVHDTSCWHAALTGLTDKNLNDTLAHNGIDINHNRDSAVYKRNPNFWATRPLTQDMIAWAAGDVQCMFELYNLQRSRALPTPVEPLQEAYLQWKHAGVERITVPSQQIGSFIGRRGANIRRLQQETNTMIYSASGEAGAFRVYYHNAQALQHVRGAVKPPSLYYY